MGLISGDRIRRSWKVIELIAAAHAVAFFGPLIIALASAAVSGFAFGQWALAGAFLVGGVVGGGTAVVLAFLSLKAVTRGYRITSCESTYAILKEDPTRHRHTVKLKIVAARPWVNIIEWRYRWSGSTPLPRPYLADPSAGTILGPVRLEGYEYYYVQLGSEMDTGDTREISMSVDLHDPEGTFEPYLEKLVKEPIDVLKLRVCLPDSQWPPKKFEAINTDGSHGPMRKHLSVDVDDDHHELSVTVKKPRFADAYRLSWAPA